MIIGLPRSKQPTYNDNVIVMYTTHHRVDTTPVTMLNNVTKAAAADSLRDARSMIVPRHDCIPVHNTSTAQESVVDVSDVRLVTSVRWILAMLHNCATLGAAAQFEICNPGIPVSTFCAAAQNFCAAAQNP